MRHPRRTTPSSGQATDGRLSTTIRRARALAIACTAALFAASTAPAQFTDINAGLTGVHHGTSVWGDYDGDGWMDLILTGQMQSHAQFTDIYKNTSGSFSAIGAGLATIGGGNGVSRGAWGDFNNDNELDVVTSGLLVSTYLPGLKLYANSAGTFSDATPSSFVGTGMSTTAWGDYDNDGDQDLFTAGYSNGPTGPWSAYLYRNDGASSGWNFTDMLSYGTFGWTGPVTRVQFADAAWGDYDKDGDLDLAVIGFVAHYDTPVTRIYRNDGGVLVNSGITNIVNVGAGAVAWGDANNDGYLDLAITGTSGYAPYGSAHFKIYTNNANGTFSQSYSASQGIADGSLCWGDYNNDGKLDLVVTGTEWPSGQYRTARVYPGNGSGGLGTPVYLYGVYESQAVFGDYDNDSRLDILLAGWQRQTSPYIDSTKTKIYRNTLTASNTAPTAPTGLAALSSSSRSLTVTWNASTDAQSPSASLTYNLYIKDATTGDIVMSPMANLSTGKRHIPAMGNTNHTRTWTIGGLTPGHTYDVCVQSIDQGYMASAFTCGLSVTLPNNDPDVMIADCSGDLGAEPSSVCTGTYGGHWNSPDIFIRNNPDGHIPGRQFVQRPIVGQPNYVYVKVKNIGAEMLKNGKVYLYYTRAATSTPWPNSWSGFIDAGVLKGDLIGTADVINLPATHDRYVYAVWNNVPSYVNTFNAHYCLLARFVSAEDPMHVPEGPSATDNARENNNIASRNITTLDDYMHGADIDIAHAMEADGIIDLGFELVGSADGGYLTDYCTLDFKLPPHILQRWMDHGAQGEGFELVDSEDGSGPVIRIVAPHVRLRGISMGPDERFTALTQVNYPEKMPDWLRGQRYYFDLLQFQEGMDMAVGGESYQVIMPGGPEDEMGKKAMPGIMDFSSLLKLSAYPNPTSAGSTISYTLPADSRVTLSLYDASGRMVTMLVDGAEQKSGRQSIEWNGTTASGAPAASGTYFYRVQTADGTAQGQIVIAR